MRHLLLFLLVLALFTASARAQNNDASVYIVTDVAVDVTADNAAHARDQAVMQAQRAAFNQLLDRLGSPASIAKKLSDDDIAAFVKSFEVQNERRSAVRYLGTFTVQFKPNTVRNYLGNHNASFSETRSSPVVILPVIVAGNKSVLWEDKTKWHAVWENSAAAAGLVPIIVPAGGLDDIAVISTAEALKGKESSLKAIANKYHAHGVVVAALSGDTDKPGTPFTIDVSHYDADGDLGGGAQITLPAATTKSGIDDALTLGVQQIRRQLEKDWQKETHEAPEVQVMEQPLSAPTPPIPQEVMQEPTSHLSITVSINSLPEWTQIERKLNSIPQVARVEVITLQRGSTSIELEFRGSLAALQFALNQQNLFLKQDVITGAWNLRPMQITGGF